MASRMIGRTTCPECGFASAHVKESEKCLYRYCPECGSQHHARTERQRGDLMDKTRLLEPTPSPTPTQEPSPTTTPSDVTMDTTKREPRPTHTEATTTHTSRAAPARRSLFS